MNKIYLNGCRPFSINNAYYRKSFTMTQKCRAWRSTILKAASLKENLKELQKFRDRFDPTTDGIWIRIVHEIPTSTFYTLKGDISRRSMDLTNVEKLLVDLLFDPRFSERGELDNICLDDKFIVKLISEKIPRQDWGILVEFDIVKTEDLNDKV